MDMTCNIAVALGIALFVVESVAAARDLLLSPMPSPDATTGATTITAAGQDATLHWLQITVVQLIVALMGACVWGCIKNSVAWRSLTGQRGHMASNAADQGIELRPAQELSNIGSSCDGYSEMEEGNASSYRGVDNGPGATSAKVLPTAQQPAAFQSPNDDAGSNAATHVTPPPN